MNEKGSKCDWLVDMMLHSMLHSLMLDPYYTHTAPPGDHELTGGPRDAVELKTLLYHVRVVEQCEWRTLLVESVIPILSFLTKKIITLGETMRPDKNYISQSPSQIAVAGEI